MVDFFIDYVAVTFGLGLLFLKSLIIVAILLLIQLFSYRILHKNPYKWLIKKLQFER